MSARPCRQGGGAGAEGGGGRRQGFEDERRGVVDTCHSTLCAAACNTRCRRGLRAAGVLLSGRKCQDDGLRLAAAVAYARAAALMEAAAADESGKVRPLVGDHRITEVCCCGAEEDVPPLARWRRA